MSKLFAAFVCTLVFFLGCLALASAKCGSDFVKTQRIQQDPQAYAARLRSLEEQEKLLLSNRTHLQQLRAAGDNVITVVFHFMWNAEQQADAAFRAAAKLRIAKEIDYSNRWFKQQNIYYPNRDPFFAATIQDTPVPISFALATLDPNGQPTPGYTETNFPYADCSAKPADSSYYDTAKGGVKPWDQTKFFNVWVCDLSGTTLGYAYLAQDPPEPNDGAVFTASGLGSDEFQGSTFVHEFMHFIRIDHTFEGGCTAPGDSVDDTPPTSASASDQFDGQCSRSNGRPTSTAADYKSCGGQVVMVENIMDYNQEPCIRYISKGQVTRMLNSFAMNPWKQLVAYSATLPSQTCTPNCAGKTCGDNGCGGSCGTCASTETCTANQCVAPAVTNTACTSATLVSTALTTIVNNKPNVANTLTAACGVNVNTITAPLWYRVAGNNKRVAVSTCGNAASSPTAVSVFSGCPANLATNCVGGNNGACQTNGQFSFCAATGTNYYIAAGTVTNAGQFNLGITFGDDCTPTPAPPPACTPTCPANTCGSNGCGGQCACPAGSTCLASGQCFAQGAAASNVDCATATAVAVTTAGTTVTVSTAGVSTTRTSTSCLATPKAPGVYYSFVGTGRVVKITTCSATTVQNLDTIISVYSGTCPNLACVTSNDDDDACTLDNTASTVTFCTTAGTTYYFDVRGYDASGPITFTITDTGAACTPFATSTCATAAAITAASATTVYDNTNAPSTLALPSCSAGSSDAGQLYNPSWHTYVATTNNTHTISTCSANTDIDTLLNLYAGNCATNTFRCLGENDDNEACTSNTRTSSLSFCATAGQTYYSTISGYNLEKGKFSVAVTDSGTPCCQATTACPVDAECGQDSCMRPCKVSGITTCPSGTVCSNFKCVGSSVGPVDPLNQCFTCPNCQNGRRQLKKACVALRGTVNSGDQTFCCNNLPASVTTTGGWTFSWKSVKACNDANSHKKIKSFCSSLGGSVTCLPPNRRNNKYRYSCSR